MPNYCWYRMKVRGKRDDRDRWKKLMETYEEDNHFWRIFESNIIENGPDYYILEGDCAWSIESCCRASGYSGGTDLLGVNSKDLNLVVEVWSEENEGGMFQEHYLYNRGKCIVSECADYCIYLWDESESFEDWKKECGLPESLKEGDLEDGYYQEGGFDDWGKWII